MRLQRSQHILRLPHRHASVSLFTGLIVALLGDDAATHAQQFTYADQLSYYNSEPTGIRFETPVGQVPGFRDYSTYLATTSPNSQLARISYVGNYGGTVGPNSIHDDAISFFRLTDDINENGVAGAIIIADPVTGFLTTMTDFDDLHTFNIAFDELTLQQRNRIRSFDADAVYWLYEDQPVPTDSDGRAALETATALEVRNHSLDNGFGPSRSPTAVTAPPRLPSFSRFTRFAANRKVGGLGLVYGYNEIAIQSGFEFNADGGILGRTFSDTEAINWIKGPQAGLVALKKWGPFSFYGHALALAGINDGNVQQDNGVGAEQIPGATNRLLYAQPTYSNHGASYVEFAPTGLLSAEAGLQVTNNTSVKLAWSAVYVYNALLAQDRMRYYLPDMGLVDPAVQHYFMQEVFCGFEVMR